ncbi:ribosome biogenesis GTPase YlqF [Paraclostridium ghonii]|uniref:ribosome biogenesis GTPase YlqF n=1 Tax=Paraclostridium ghonii TaxID=29358 RepID=UPI00202CD2F1|nr:ribosome biogenesis GTPase YlqF [Paeniclostridium ghonii]MCM0165173.1 ribosome biogenesis GTPase YlqF [Paeniclostridium ghonii]
MKIQRMTDEYLKDDSLHINWYPGHMKKTKELVKTNLKLVDVVVELLDARIPFSSRNPDIDRFVGDKPRVVVLNKSDISDPNKLNQWVDYYKKRGIKAIPVDTLKGKGVNKIIEECKNETKEKMEALVKKGRIERPIRIMIVGIPNVGKSSLINKLTGRKSTQTGDKPGVTKGKQWVKLKGNLELLDTPGILWPKFEDEKVALKLAFCRAIKDEVLDVDTLGLKLIEKLMEIEPEKLKERFKLDELGETPIEIMDKIGIKRGLILRKNELDYTRIATTVLNEFRDGKIGRITLETPKDMIEC